jgi:hypothetical protein
MPYASAYAIYAYQPRYPSAYAIYAALVSIGHRQMADGMTNARLEVTSMSSLSLACMQQVTSMHATAATDAVAVTSARLAGD